MTGMRFRYPPVAQWFKGNTHIHTTFSDGGKTPDEVAALYASEGYHFLFSTDHNIPSDVAHDRAPAPLLWLDGVELDGKDEQGGLFHIVCLGRFEGLDRQKIKSLGLAQSVAEVRRQGGLVILAHPFWSGNTFTDTQAWPFDGVEIYNHVCQWLNGKGDGRTYWNYMLSQPGGGRVLAFAADDAHLLPQDPSLDGGWIKVNAPELSAQAIFQAIRQGNYYASTGPEITDLSFDGAALNFTCSPVRFARLIGPAYEGERLAGFDGSPIVEGRFCLPTDWAYAYLEIEDDRGQRAWTNSLFLP